MIYEEEIRDSVIDLVLETGASSFDTYFMTIAKLYNATLITDDEPMAIYAERIGIDTILVRRISRRELIAKIDKLVNN